MSISPVPRMVSLVPQSTHVGNVVAVIKKAQQLDPIELQKFLLELKRAVDALVAAHP